MSARNAGRRTAVRMGGVFGALVFAVVCAGCGDVGGQMVMVDATAERQPDNTVDVTAGLECTGTDEPCEGETCVSAEWYDGTALEEPDTDIGEVDRGESTELQERPQFSDEPVVTGESCHEETTEVGESVDVEIPSGGVVSQPNDWWIHVEITSGGGFVEDKQRLAHSP